VIRTTATGDSPYTQAQLDEQLEQDRRLREIKQAAAARQLERAQCHNVLAAAERELSSHYVDISDEDLRNTVTVCPASKARLETVSA
jgi:tRNA A-37 threonylcarbamoyl transferase component Bud32